MLRNVFYLFLMLTLLLDSGVIAQSARPVGLREQTPAVFALVNATITSAPGEVTSNATLVIRDGYIESVGRRVDIPADAAVIDLQGKMIYPGFIDAYTHYGLPGLEDKDSPHWNPHIRPHISSARHFTPDPKQAGQLRKQGFVLAHTLPEHGLLSGTGSVVSLGEGKARYQLIEPDASQHMAFQISEKIDSDYPTSSMGAVALLRQSLLDAEWYARAQAAYREGSVNKRPETNLGLATLHQAVDSQLPFVIPVNDENWFLRAQAIAEEFSLQAWVKGSGYEYRRMEAIRDTGMPVILPLNFPEAPEVKSPEASVNITLEELRHWYFAPENPARMVASGLQTAFTAHGDTDNFLDNLRMAVNRGLDPQDALAALTTTPADMLGIAHHYGTLETGKKASFIIASGDIFDPSTRICQVWVDGSRHTVNEVKEKPAGEWLVESTGSLENARISIEGSNQRLRGKITLDEQSVHFSNVDFDDTRIHMHFPGDSIGMQGHVRLSAHLSEDELLGLGEHDAEPFFTWSASRTSSADAPEDREQFIPELDLPERYPSLEYGIASTPEQPKHVILRNATIWTQGPEGILQEADMLISDGQVAAVGHQLDAPRRALEIDATGKHITPGLIDPHIHTSIAGGVNETGDAITSETRITDVMHADNVWIYRLLAGGITSATLFHGSANPIGGQNAVIKPRWGMMGEALLIEDAAPGLKFALGENVKRMETRYPSSRQGVEQIIRDAFEAALEYETQWQRWEEGRESMPPRRDLQLEAILEVIRGERLAHVHAYRQDEMLMMMRLAETYGFTIGSFEHTLEGYKIADELRTHGASAVIWTDWSSFKVEAYDGILYNARLLEEAGVHTSLHSDNTQLATRMNWEAAKVMMTGVEETTALDMITTRPARIMGIDHRTGSLEPGKDADFVLWNGHPMSTFTSAEQTWIEGRKYFDREEDQRLREEVREERTLIINAILDAQQN